MALCAGNDEHVVQNEEFPKNIEVIIGKLDHCAYAGIYEREPVMFNMIYIMILILIDFMMRYWIYPIYCVGFNNKSIGSYGFPKTKTRFILDGLTSKKLMPHSLSR